MIGAVSSGDAMGAGAQAASLALMPQTGGQSMMFMMASSSGDDDENNTSIIMMASMSQGEFGFQPAMFSAADGAAATLGANVNISA